MSAPVRSDLANVQPLFYVAVEQACFTVAALCRRLQVPAQELQTALDLARINGSTHVVLDRLVLGKPEDKRCAVLFPQPGGAVLLAVGMFAHLTPDEAQARADMAMLSARAEFKGRRVMLCEFRPNVQGAMQ